MKNRYIKIFCIAIVSAMTLASCDKGFEEMNTNPNALTDPAVKSMFTLAEIYVDGQDFSNTRGNNIYAAQIVQQFSSPGGAGSKYTYSSEYSGALFGETYGKGLNQIFQLMSVLPNTDENSNAIQALRIMKVLMFQKLTDTYGEVPYFEAGKGYNGNIFAPKYDTQEAIYNDLLKELDEAGTALDANKGFVGAADLYYQSDVARWKKLANSLMLRVAMRLSKVNPAKAKEYVEKAVSKGVFASNTDSLVLQHDSGPAGVKTNPITSSWVRNDLNGGESNIKFSKTFIDLLKNTNDPRLRIYAKLEATGDNNPANQQGLANDAKDFPGGDKKVFSDPNTSTVLRLDAPTLIMSYAEVQYLLAEASVRGWNVGGSAQGYYENGVKAAMEVLTIFGDKVPAVTGTEYTTYITTYPFKTAGTEAQKIEQIITQKWILLLFNGFEAFSEYRRTGYPVLVPVNDPTGETNGTIPRRLIYDQSELLTNADNYQQAISRQGLDRMTTRIWWDK
ncbi:SusD/RagB family nutrient-binding outer membrane lipoprotein [Flavobacterium sp. ANB]|uniref:SusD/RagB family nutrient-binding outer membrane lipoprotein n=1 Tax=unclassified Flavobacterium TaxID=196869 RepID=UPI0012B7360A|nr:MULTISPECIES: SusD/RagB family nutrient-binding outer membrane lipoprotein [unclassified Flavobacterium]MBF4517869.1 SusD/RagB family nutrient-binding outer membrane lipoprotein [Flavobacterium sp. ANB]MTD72061.1 SusD/RagB family nutrient-binding outer membrane lipoprotein [Flavobacterium sp. LC2016-13]